MAKIAMIGAGSIIFCKTLMSDIMATPGLESTHFALMSPTEMKLRRMEKFANELIRENNLSATVEATTDRRKALDGADYVVLMIQVGGVDAFQMDYEIPMRYGVDQCIGDSMGPGGIFRALRSIPVLLDIAKDIKELCPKALVLNYVNPMAANCWALSTVPKLGFVGLCHGVQTTLDLIAGYLGEPKECIDYLCAGINHMAWFLKLEKAGKDLYPLLREKFEQPEYYINEKVRGEVFRHFGYFMTESTGHLSEYVPWFRKSKKALELYCDMPDFGGASGAYYKYCRTITDKFADTDFLSIESRKLEKRSAEYCSYIIEALELDKPFSFNGNLRNDSYITNLPNGCCVEVPIYADGRGLHPAVVGNLPPQCAALNMTNVLVQGLTVEAAISGNPELVMQAAALDPLTSAVCTLHEVREMVREMMEAESKWLPQFEGKKLADVPVISIPPNTVPAKVPQDPALAIAARFAKLAAS
ncbi:MAG TPA: alpha-galactosidase [Armatimonadota bacterium]|nr:alpha-galactosidase [Armatimonadota bacterium]HPP74652.1 alpha-galactosidase [Armatimonadota bacterium]